MSRETDLIDAFVVPARRSRYLALLETKRGRERLRQQLPHFHDFDPRTIVAIPSSQQHVDGIYALLKQLGAPESCHVISESNAIDLRELDLRTALATTVGHGFGTVISCVSGVLAYYEGEEANDRYILQRLPRVRSQKSSRG